MIKSALTSRTGERVAGAVELVSRLIGRDGWFLAGGSVRETFFGLPVSNDLDVYFLSSEALANAHSQLGACYQQHHSTSKAVCYSVEELGATMKVDLIKNIQESKAVCIAAFDFTCCQWAADPNGLIMTEAALADSIDKRLVLANSQNAASSLMRVPKYLAKGFKADIELMHQLATMINQQTAIDIPSVLEGKSSRGGADVADPAAAARAAHLAADEAVYDSPY
jgi:hypothetical protein